MLLNKKISTKIILVLIMYVISQPFLFESVLAQGQDGALPSRDQIEAKYKWDLTPVYESIDLWEQDFAWVKGKTAGYAAFQGKLGSSARSLLEFLKYDEEIGIKFGRVHLYAFLSKDLDLADTKYQALYDRTMGLATQLSEASAFFRPELLSIPEAKLKDYLSEEKGLAVYEHMLNELLRSKDHTLDKEKEELLAMASQVTRIPYDIFGMFKNADIQFPKVADENGQEIQVSDGRYYAALYSNDRAYRERVYKAYYQPFNDYKNTMSAMFNGNLKSLNFSAKARKYSTDREAALDENNIPLSVYDNLVNSAYNNTSPLHRWCEMKKKVLGLPDMHPYDTYVTLFPSVSKDYTYDEAVDLVMKALAPLGDDYIKSIKTAFDNRWVDVYETKGKRSGAYSSGTTFGVHPYVLLNWNDQLNDVFTLAHEMGHNMHSYYTGLNQPYPYANYSIFVAEVASTMNEALLLDYLIEHASTKEEKLSLIEKNLNNITTTFYRQTRFAQYEQMVHEKTEKGEPLTADLLSDMYGELYQAYWGPGMTVDEEEKLTWTRIPHFYYNFYVYQYATSFAASQALAEKVKVEGAPAIEKYLKFLQSGSSVYPIDLLKITGVDMTSEETIMAVVNKMNSLLDQMEQLLNE